MARRGWTLGAAAAAIVMGSGFESQAATAPRTAPPSSTRSAKAAPPKGTGKPAKAPAAPRPVGGAAPGRAPAPRAPAKAGGGAAQTAKPAPPTVVPPRGTPGSASALPHKGPAPAPKGAADAPPVPMAAPVGKPEPDRPSAEAPRTAVLPLEVAGNIRASRPALERALATGLGGVGAALLPADETARRLAGRPPAARCRDEACWRELGAALGVSRLVGGAVTRSEGQFIVDLQLVDGGSGRTLREKRGRCDEEYCSVADLVRRSAAELASARVADAAPAASPELPPRAPVGGARAETGLVQPPDLRTAPPEPKSAWRTYAPHAVIGAGVAALAVAVIAFRRDGSCIQAGCLYRYTALPEGIALTGAGVALVGTGVYFLLSDGPGAPGPRAAAPALGAGWAGRF